jgi:hypothetical protein
MSSTSESRLWYTGIDFTKKWRAETLQPGLDLDNFKPRLTSGILNCISWLNSSIFGANDCSFLNDGVKAYLMATTSLLNSPTSFLSSHP